MTIPLHSRDIQPEAVLDVLELPLPLRQRAAAAFEGFWTHPDEPFEMNSGPARHAAAVGLAVGRLLACPGWVLAVSPRPARLLRDAAIALERLGMLRLVCLQSNRVETGSEKDGWKDRNRLDAAYPGEISGEIGRNRYQSIILAPDLPVSLTYRQWLLSKKAQFGAIFEFSAAKSAAEARISAGMGS